MGHNLFISLFLLLIPCIAAQAPSGLSRGLRRAVGSQRTILLCIQNIPDTKGNFIELLNQINNCTSSVPTTSPSNVQSVIRALQDPTSSDGTCPPHPSISSYFTTNPVIQSCGRTLGQCVSSAKAARKSDAETFGEVTRCLSVSFVCAANTISDSTNGANNTDEKVLSARRRSDYFALIYYAFSSKQTCVPNNPTCVTNLGCGIASTANQWFSLDSLATEQTPPSTTVPVTTQSPTVAPTPKPTSSVIPPDKITDIPWDPAAEAAARKSS